MRDDPDPAWDESRHNPYNWPEWKKWLTLGASCWTTFLVGLNATSITTPSEPIATQFDIHDGLFEYTFLTVTAWNGAAALVPLFTLPLMDTYGIRYGYVAAYIGFTAMLIPQALAHNYATLVVCRVLAGAFGGTLQNVPDAIAANIFRTNRQRVLPLTVYVFCLLFGVTMGPVLGAVYEPLGWRWVFWIQLITCALFAPVIWFVMFETRGSVLQSQLSPPISAQDKQHSESGLKNLKTAISRSIILLATEPTIASFTIWTSFAFGLVFISTQSIPLVFSTTYDWRPYSGGLVQASMGIGQIVGLGATLLQNQIYLQSSPPAETPVPEYILPLSVPSTVAALAGGLFMYGWGTFQSHWAVLALGLGFVGFASMVIVHAATIYVTDAYYAYAASAIAAVAFGENVFAAVLPLAAKAMYINLGFQWASTLLALLAVVLTSAPVVLFWKGQSIRSRSSTMT